MKINYEQLYQFEDPINKAFRVGSIEEKDTKNSLHLLRGEFKPDSIIPFRYYMGNSKPSSIIWSGMFDVIIKKSVAEILKENGITGYRLYEVIVYGKAMEKYDNYYGLSITGRCNTKDYYRSKLVYLGSANVPYLKGVYFVNDYWDGSDFFVEEPDEKGNFTARIYVSQKVVSLFKKYKVQNIKFEKLSESTSMLRSIQIGKQYKLPPELRNMK
ncbi:hypothetical protein ACFTQ7_21735 [Lysinibacillus sp. NPDC056959]|uniref:hypothetical protein n=1 Tax=Lysinibacillus sp. NPDC056959 TaxID=3345981 RepID=UPI00362965BA